MKPRTFLIAVPLLYLAASAGSRLLDGRAAVGDSSAPQLAPPQAPDPGGAASPVSPVEPETPLARPATFPILRATTPAEVREVLRITKAATREDRAALTDAALHAEDPLVAGNALRALGRLKLFASDPALLALTADPRLRVRQDAVTACGLDGSAHAIPYLGEALAHGDESLRPLVLDALGKIGGAEARDLVQRVADDPLASRTDRVFARSALRGMQG